MISKSIASVLLTFTLICTASASDQNTTISEYLKNPSKHSEWVKGILIAPADGICIPVYLSNDFQEQVFKQWIIEHKKDFKPDTKLLDVAVSLKEKWWKCGITPKPTKQPTV